MVMDWKGSGDSGYGVIEILYWNLLEGLTTTTINLNKVNWCPVRDSNLAPPKYNSRNCL
jgi:hypothetical protein